MSILDELDKLFKFKTGDLILAPLHKFNMAKENPVPLRILNRVLKNDTKKGCIELCYDAEYVDGRTPPHCVSESLIVKFTGKQ